MTAQKFSRPGSASPAMALSPLSARPIDRRPDICQGRNSRKPPTRSLRTRNRVFAVGSRQREPRHASSARLSGSFRSPRTTTTSRSSVTAAPAPCSIATSRDCRSIGVMTSPRQTAGTGLPLTGRPESFFAMAGNQSIRRQVQTREPVRPDQVSIVPSMTATASAPIVAPTSARSCTVTESVIRLGRPIS